MKTSGKAAVQPQETPKKLPPEFRRDEEFVGRYANNAQFEGTSWDLKIVFGQTELSVGPNVVLQHTAMTLPWNYAKIFCYLLSAQVAAHEAENGRVLVPRNILGPPPDSIPEGLSTGLQHPEEQLEAVKKLWREFVDANPELK